MFEYFVIGVSAFVLGIIMCVLRRVFTKANGVLYIFDDRMEANFVDGYEDLCTRRQVVLDVQVRKS